jgi:hypothetical protein
MTSTATIRPTNQEINGIAAELCVWKRCGGSSGFSMFGWLNPNGDYVGDCPDFCGDANLLPRLLDEVAKRERRTKYTYIYTLGKLLPDTGESGPSEWLFERAPLRLKVIAALMACERWPKEWNAYAE